MWGALAGAVVGAFASAVFALGFRKRDERQAYENRLDEVVARVVSLLGTSTAAQKAFMFAMKLGNASVPAVPPREAQAELIAAIQVARMAADGDDDLPISAVHALVTTPQEDSTTSGDSGYGHAAHQLLCWRRGEISANQAAQSIREHSPVTDLSV